MDTSLNAYAVLGIFLLVAVAVPLGMLGISKLGGYLRLRPERSSFRKRAAYESGMKAYSKRPRNFNLRYYHYAILFIAFDVEVLFLYPWALRYGLLTKEFGFIALGAALFFLFVVTVPFVYAWKKGALKWEK